MGAFALIGVLLLMAAVPLRSGRLALFAAFLFGIGVVGDGGGMGVFAFIGMVIGVAAMTREDRRLGILAVIVITCGIAGDINGWFQGGR